jgi:hypothetical protein
VKERVTRKWAQRQLSEQRVHRLEEPRNKGGSSLAAIGIGGSRLGRRAHFDGDLEPEFERLRPGALLEAGDGHVLD